MQKHDHKVTNNTTKDYISAGQDSTVFLLDPGQNRLLDLFFTRPLANHAHGSIFCLDREPIIGRD